MKNYRREKLFDWPFAQNLDSPNSKGKYESRKISDFARKNEKNLIFLKFLNFF
jgi:hypothetical protein